MSARSHLAGVVKPLPIKGVRWAETRAKRSPYPLAYWLRQAIAHRYWGWGEE